ncbi:MAG: NAD-dependent epimerase/dehydratase family protein [Lentisphaerae bacterium]|nr:NAD-dependent epimerase/dehydratase family protein [Lentisphaerota bacterium]
MIKATKILITGAGGFIGRNLVPLLLENGYEVTALIRPSSDMSSMKKLNIGFLVDPGSAESLTEKLKDVNVGGIIHLASCFRPEHSSKDVGEIAESNISFPLRLLDAAAAAGVPWFINTGTVWQHYMNRKYSPVNLYAASKQAFLDISQFYVENSSVIFTTIELGDTFGEDDPRKKVISLWMEAVREGKTLDMSPGRQVLSLTHVENVCDAYLKLSGLLENDGGKLLSGKTFRAAGKGMTLKKLSSVFEKVSGKMPAINWGARPYRKKETMSPFSKGIPVPGWREKLSIEEGLRRVCRKAM